MPCIFCVGQVAQSVQRLATGWTVRGSNPGGGEIFRTCPDRPWGPPRLLYNGYRSFPGGKERSGRAIGHERVDVYLYSSYGPYGLYRASVPVQGWPIPLPFLCIFFNNFFKYFFSHFASSSKGKFWSTLWTACSAAHVAEKLLCLVLSREGPMLC